MMLERTPLSPVLDAPPPRCVSAGDEWRAHWTLVIAAMAGVGISTIMVYSAGLFIEPLQSTFGWSRTQIAIGPSISALIALLCGPFAGNLIDRVGPRRIAIVGVVASCVAVSLFSLAGPGIASWWCLWLLLSFSHLGVGPTVWTSAVSGAFYRARGLALALTLCGSGVASFITPLLAYHLIEAFGWRTAYIGIAVCWGAVVLPLILLYFQNTANEGDTEQRYRDRQTYPRGYRRKKFAQPTFILIAIAGCIVSAVGGSLVANFVPILKSGGVTRANAASIASLVAFAAITGRLVIGNLLDHMEGRWLASLSAILPIGTCILLIAFPGSMLAAVLAILLLGLAFGAELDILAYMTSRYFEIGHFGLFFGTIAGLIALGAGLMPIAINYAYDSFGTYLPALYGMVPISLIAATLFLALPSYPRAMTQASEGREAFT